MKRFSIPLLFFLLCTTASQAQYFGRNKPRYEKQDFKVTQTEHFELYEYLHNPEKLRELAAAAEQWYAMHQAVLRDTFTEKNPMIIYSNHAGFQQTTAIGGDISVGTGGVTEGLRNRVVFPVAMTNQQTDHVMGHELVHAFQYHMILNGDSTSMRNFANLPLWMVEGLAEYLSIGRVDAQTAMWMRDAVKNDDLPRIKDLDKPKYFPYRWGQSFWAFVTGVYGDEVIQPLFVNTAKQGLEPAIKMILHTTPDSLSKAWQEALRSHYGRWVIKNKADDLPGKSLLNADNAGKLNICPVLSPNGKYVIFLSEKNLFTTDLFLADAKTGNILKKVASTVNDSHIDQFNFIESAGTWSPDSKRYAFDVYEKGHSVLVIKEVFGRGKAEKISLPGVPAFTTPAWSPDGKTIVVSGLVNGQTDLYAYDLKTGQVRQLTNDRAAEILPNWSADGKSLTFSTDQLSLSRGRTNGAWPMTLAVMDYATGKTDVLDLFTGADNLNPQFDKDGNILFLSNRDGFRNLYRYEPATKKVFQLTNLQTGISGITPYAPAITVAEDRDRILYTYYNKGDYAIYQASTKDFKAIDVTTAAVDLVPATLPPFNPRQRDLVNTNLRLMDVKDSSARATTLQSVPYRPKFSLAYLGGSAGVGVATGNSSFGATSGLAGGVDMLFDDILGNNQLYAGLSLNGEISDAAGQFSYINQKNRLNWGISLSHLPYRSGAAFASLGPAITADGDTLTQNGYTESVLLRRIFQERIGVFTFFPFSTTKRFEIGTAFEYYHDRVDIYNNYYELAGLDGAGYPVVAGYYGADRQRLPGSPGLSISNLNAALVGDNSYFGVAAPLQGWRYRLGAEQYFGAYKFSTLLADGRRYFYRKPFTLAVRGLAYGRLGGNANNTDEVYPLFAAQSYFVRGYTSKVLYDDAPELVDQMVGSKIAVANVEIRLPFTGPRRLAVIPSKFLLTDLNLFFDAGLGFFTVDDLKKESSDPDSGIQHIQHKPILSTGVSLRLNLFGALVLEPYFALPLSVAKENRQWVFGLNFAPGW